jgi:membrane-bound ClpP family serine protease
MSDDSKNNKVKYEIAGWILFILCSGLFIISSVINGDVVALAGSVLFLVGCLVFFIPTLKER